MRLQKWNWKAIASILALTALLWGVLSLNGWLKTCSPGRDIQQILRSINLAVTSSDPDWPRLSKLTEELARGWPSVRDLLQFNGEKDDLMRFERAVNLLRAAVEIEDRAGSKEQIALMQSIWSDL